MNTLRKVTLAVTAAARLTGRALWNAAGTALAAYLKASKPGGMMLYHG